MSEELLGASAAAAAPAVLNRAMSLDLCPTCMALLGGCSAETIAATSPTDVLRGLVSRVEAGKWMSENVEEESTGSTDSSAPTLQHQLEALKNRSSGGCCASCFGLLCDPIHVLGDEIYEHIVASYPTAFATATFALEVVLPVVLDATRMATRVIKKILE